MSVLDVRILRILLHSAWKSTCKVQNMYDGEPYDVIFNQWNVFSRIVDRTFCFDIWQRIICSIVTVTRKVYVVVVNEEKQKIMQRSLLGSIVKDNTKFYCIYKNPDWDFESVVERFRLCEKKKTRK